MKFNRAHQCFFLFACVGLSVSSHSTYAAIHPQSWFDIYDWKSSGCSADAFPPKVLKTGRLRTYFVNTTSRPLRIGVWSVKKQTMRVHREIAAGEKVRWTVNDQFKFYVLDPIARECIGAFKASYADSDRSIDILRGLDYERPVPKPKKNNTGRAREAPKSQPVTVEEKALQPPTDSRPKKSTVASTNMKSRKPTERAVRGSDYLDLRRLVNGFNARRGRINADYSLENVSLDITEKNLVYRFTTLKPLEQLDTTIFLIANKTAYCKASKIAPFREENFSAIYSYRDSDGNTFEMRATTRDC